LSKHTTNDEIGLNSIFCIHGLYFTFDREYLHH